MTNKLQFEDLEFSQAINIIPEHIFPTSFPIHWHTYIEILYLTSEATPDSTVNVTVNDRNYTLKPCDILIIWPGELHEIIYHDTKHLVGIQFNPSLLHTRHEFTDKHNQLRQHHLISASDHPETSTKMLHSLNKIFSYYLTNDYFREVHMLIQIYECFIAYSQFIDTVYTSSKQIDPTLGKENIQAINSACNYIIKNCSHELTLKQVADYTGFSVYYFSRLFKQTTNYSFTEYVTLQRIRYAQQMLSDSSQSITEIAFQAGFKSISTFNRVFKQYKGYSPREFRSYFCKQ